MDDCMDFVVSFTDRDMGRMPPPEIIGSPRTSFSALSMALYVNKNKSIRACSC